MKRVILEELGMSKFESELYLILLENEQLSAYDLAKKAGFYRQVTYDSLNRLLEKGFISSVKEGKSQLFRAVSPELLFENLKQKIENFQKLLPDLKKLEKTSSDSLIVETYKGDNIVRTALRDIINTLKTKRGEVLCTAIDEFIPFSRYPELHHQYERDMINYGIKERVIIQEGTNGIFKKGTSQYKKIKENYFNSNPTQIYGDNVQILVWGNPNYLVIIRSKKVAESYKKQFELLWKIAKR